MKDPEPTQMLFEGAVDTVATLKLMRLGAKADVPFRDALDVIETAIVQLEYAISAALDAKVSA